MEDGRTHEQAKVNLVSPKDSACPIYIDFQHYTQCTVMLKKGHSWATECNIIKLGMGRGTRLKAGGGLGTILKAGNGPGDDLRLNVSYYVVVFLWWIIWGSFWLNCIPTCRLRPEVRSV